MDLRKTDSGSHEVVMTIEEFKVIATPYKLWGDRIKQQTMELDVKQHEQKKQLEIALEQTKMQHEAEKTKLESLRSFLGWVK